MTTATHHADHRAIEHAFARADLPVRVVDDAREIDVHLRAGRGRSTREIFAMDIRARGRNQEFVLSPGVADVHVLNVSRRLHQLVLYVREPENEVVVTSWRWRPRRRVDRTVHIPESRRHLLVGMDESHLFACRLPDAVSTVARAHQVLAPRSVRVRSHGVRRQGEWFFRRVDDVATERALAQAADAPNSLRLRRVGLGHGLRLRGRPHVADEVAVIAPSARRPFESRVERVADGTHRRIPPRFPFVQVRELARGSVRHPDHRTLKLGAHWHVVERNTEPMEAPPVPNMTWID